jgi:hypothetical protein
MSEKTAVRLYYAPQRFPCGPQSSCCGPVGQTEAEVEDYTRRLREALPDATLDAINISLPLRLGRDGAVIRLLNTFGHEACPIVAVNGEVVSMGPPAMGELVDLIKAKLAGGARSRGA